MKKLILLFLFGSFVCILSAQKWQPLFDGKSLEGWTKYLGVPHKSVDLPNERDAKGNFLKPLEFDTDPLSVFNVIDLDGKPVIYVTGQVFGVIQTKDSFENYHIKVNFKWGNKKWPPRENMVRDAGLLYHICDLPKNNIPWPAAQESQIQEGDCGDYWPTGEVFMDIPAIKSDTSKFWVYAPGAPFRTTFYSTKMEERRIIKAKDHEKAFGKWNTMEVICWGNQSVHLVNGKVVMRLYNSQKNENGKKVPLTKGPIALQSEGAEVYYSDVYIKQLNKKPKYFK